MTSDVKPRGYRSEELAINAATVEGMRYKLQALKDKEPTHELISCYELTIRRLDILFDLLKAMADTEKRHAIP